MTVSKVESTEEKKPVDVAEQVALCIISALLVLLGQSLIHNLADVDRWPAYILISVGLLLFLITIRSFVFSEFPTWFRKPIQAASQWMSLSTGRFHFLWTAPIFSLGGWLAAGDLPLMRSFPTAVLAWIIAILFLIVGFWDQIKLLRYRGWTRQDTWIILSVTFISLLLRGLLLDRIPWVLTGDEGSAGLSAVEFIKGIRNNIFTVGWFSFPAMFFGVQSLSIRLLGQTILGLRLPSMIMGTLAIPTLYVFTRMAFGRKAAIMASAFLATFHFHIHFSRIGLNNIWDGFFVLLFSIFFWRGWKSVDSPRCTAWGLFMLAGLALGIGQYFYTSVRVLAGMLALALLILAIQNWSEFRKRIPGLMALSTGTLVVILPLAIYYLKFPDQFSAPFQRVSILGPWLENEIIHTGNSAWVILFNQFKTAALAFTHVHLRHWYMPNHPMLLLIPSALFLLGVAFLLVHIKDSRYNWLVIWIISAITISALSESTPASQRLTFVAPAVAIVVVLPLNAMIDWFGSHLIKRPRLPLLLAGTILVLSIANDLFFYFVEYSANQKFSDNNTETANAVANYLLALDEEIDVMFCGLPRMGYFSHSTIPYLVPEAIGIDVLDDIFEPPASPITKPTVYIFLPERLDEMEFVQQAFPEGNIVVKKGREFVHLFTAYEIPALDGD